MMMKRYLVSDLGGTRVLFFFFLSLNSSEETGDCNYGGTIPAGSTLEKAGREKRREQRGKGKKMNTNRGEAGLSAVLKVGCLHGPVRAQYGCADRSLNKQSCQSKENISKGAKKKRLQKFVMTDSGLARSCIITAALTARDLDKSKKIHGPLAGHWPMHTPTWEMTKKKISKTKYNKIINKTLGKKKKERWEMELVIGQARRLEETGIFFRLGLSGPIRTMVVLTGGRIQ